MDRQQILAQLSEVLADILDSEPLTLTDATTADEVPGWDSIAHIKLIIALEGEYGITFTPEEATAPESVGAFVDVIQAKVNAS